MIYLRSIKRELAGMPLLNFYSAESAILMYMARAASN
ncbi:MAG: hypothetical protein JWM11_6797 [Planctomycetaceae bacterium]|nr:hypothetical protein [Planctomycetaceae bacterium]